MISLVLWLQAPRWAFLLCAIGLFIYQSLDAIDGKQARRTDSSSPLGELFDHGCDSISTGNYLIWSFKLHDFYNLMSYELMFMHEQLEQPYLCFY